MSFKLLQTMRKRRGMAFLLELMVLSVVVGILASGILNAQSANWSSLTASRVATYAEQLARSKANEINATAYGSLASTAEARTAVAGTNFDREVIIGVETTLASGVRETPVTVNIYRTGEADPRYTLPITASSAASASGVPSGTIILWHGTIASIPSGWRLCDGSNGTPDLRNRFIVGAGADGGVHTPGTNGVGPGYYSPHATGGQDMHQLTIAEMPAHNHYMHGNQSGQPLPWQYGYTDAYTMPSVSFTGANPWTEGGNSAHETRPPYYSLAYIMKE